MILGDHQIEGGTVRKDGKVKVGIGGLRLQRHQALRPNQHLLRCEIYRLGFFTTGKAGIGEVRQRDGNALKLLVRWIEKEVVCSNASCGCLPVARGPAGLGDADHQAILERCAGAIAGRGGFYLQDGIQSACLRPGARRHVVAAGIGSEYRVIRINRMRQPMLGNGSRNRAGVGCLGGDGIAEAVQQSEGVLGAWHRPLAGGIGDERGTGEGFVIHRQLIDGAATVVGQKERLVREVGEGIGIENCAVAGDQLVVHKQRCRTHVCGQLDRDP